MEKRKPHCSLAAVKALVAAGKVRTTNSARSGAAALGFDYSGMTDRSHYEFDSGGLLQKHDCPC